MQELKGRFLIKGKRLNKLDAAFNNNTSEDVDSVSEEDEAAELKEGEPKPKDKVCWKTLQSFRAQQHNNCSSMSLTCITHDQVKIYKELLLYQWEQEELKEFSFGKHAANQVLQN